MISGMETSPEVFKEVENFCLTIGKEPTRCANVPGFVANRIQMAMAAEAIKIVSQGLASPREVDAIIRSTIGFRLGAFGPFEIADMAGADTYLAIMQYMREKYGWGKRRGHLLPHFQVEKGRLGLKAGKGFYDYDEAGGRAYAPPAGQLSPAPPERLQSGKLRARLMHISLGYGNGVIEADIDDARVDAVLRPNDITTRIARRS